MNLFRRYMFFWLFLLTPLLYSQPEPLNGEKPDLSIQLSALIEPNHVPLNRVAHLKVQVTWQGQIDRVEIEEVQEPLLSHLEITGSARHICRYPGCQQELLAPVTIS